MKAGLVTLTAISLAATVSTSAGAEVVNPQVLTPIVTPHPLSPSPAPIPPPSPAPAANLAPAPQATAAAPPSAAVTYPQSPHPISGSRASGAEDPSSDDSGADDRPAPAGSGTLLLGYYENVIRPAFQYSDMLNFLPGRSDLLEQSMAKVIGIADFLRDEAQRGQELECQCSLPPESPSPSEEPAGDDEAGGGFHWFDDEPPKAEE